MMQRQLSPEMMQQLQAARMQMMQTGQISPEMMQQVQAARMQMMQHMSGAPIQFPSPAAQCEHETSSGGGSSSLGGAPAAAASLSSPLKILMSRLGGCTLLGGLPPASGEARSAYEKELEKEVTMQGQTLVAFTSALLAQHPAAVTDTDESGRTLMHHACLHGQLTVTELLLKCNADVNARDRAGATPVHMAAMRGDPLILQRLRERGADMRRLDEQGQSAMHYAAAGRSACTLHYLSECCGLSYADIDLSGRSLLHAACQQSGVDGAAAAAAATVVEHLLRNGRIDPLLKDANGCNAMHYAAEAPLVQACYDLAMVGSSRLVCAANSAGITPLDITRRGSATEHYGLFRDMEHWLQRSQPYYPGLTRSTAWYQYLITAPGYLLVAVLLSHLLTPSSQGWIVTLGFVLSCCSTFGATNTIQQGEARRMPNPTRLGAAVGYMVLSTIAYFLVIMPAVYGDRPFASVLLAATIPISIYLYIQLCAGDPGYLTQSKRKDTGDLYTMQDLVTVFQRPDVWCEVCEIVRTKPSKHCTTCRRCCFKVDQHCSYTMNCVGSANRRQFVWLCIIVFVQQLLFCSLAMTYYDSGRPSVDGFWSAVGADFRGSAWMVATCAASIICLPLTFRHLVRTLDLLSRGYNSTFQPEPDEPESCLSAKERMANVYSFLMRGALVKTDFL